MIQIPAATQGFLSGGNGIRLFCQYWRHQDPCAEVVLAHGYGEHSGRYLHVAEALYGAGCSVRALDHRGHGRSEGVRAHVERFQDFVDDLAAFIERVRAETPGLPLFLLGHSMGGLMAAHYATRHPDRLAGLILSGPAVKIDHLAPPIVIAAARILSLVAPQLGIVPPDLRVISRDPNVVAAAESDPLFYHGKTRARLGYEMLRASRAIQALAPAIKTPLLVIQGDADLLVQPKGVQAFFDATASADKTIVRFPEAFHEVLNDPEGEEALALITQWIRHRASVDRRVPG